MKTKAIKPVLKVVIPYLLFGGFYIAFSDRFVQTIAQNQNMLTELQTYKGWGFIILTSLLLVILLFRFFDKLERERNGIALLKETLSRSENLYHSLFMNSGEAIIITNRDGSFKAANPEACRIFGRTEEEICRIGREGITDPTDPRLQEALEERKSNGIFKGELNFLRSDGSTFPGDVVTTAFKDMNGVERASIIIRDLSEKKLAKEALLLAHTRLRRFVDSNIIGVVVAAADGRILEANDYYLDMIGYTRKELEDGKVDWRKLTPQEWLFTDEKALIELKENGICTPYEKEYQKRDGSRVAVYLADAMLPGTEETIAAFALNITDRKRVELELIESEARYRSLFENMSEGFAYCKMIYENDIPVDFIYLKTNPKFSLLTRLKDVEGKRVSDVIPGFRDSNPDIIEVYGRVAMDGEAEHFESFVSLLNDWYSVSVYCPKKQYFVAVFDVITERKLADEALKESEEKYRTITENIDDVVWTLDVVTERFTYVSPSVFNLRGYTPEEIIVKPVYEALTPESIVSLNKITAQRIAEFISNQNSSKSYLDQIEQPCKDGSTVWTEVVTSYYINEKTGNINVRGVTRNISERKKFQDALIASEERFRSTLDNMLEGCQIIDSDWRYIYINDSGDIHNRRPKSELLGRRYMDVWPGIEETQVFRTIKDCIDNKATHQFENEFTYPDGNIGWFDLSIQPVAEGIFILSIDITDRKKAEQEILNSRENLRALTARLEKVREEERIHLSRELHDHLGQNLTGLKMDVAYVEKHIRNDSKIDEESILLKTKGMVDLIDDLIKNVRKISGELRPNVLDYLGLIPAIEWQIEEFTKRTEIECMYDSNSSKIDLGMEINSSVFRIIQEAFTNIIRHSKATKVDLGINEKADSILIEIKDNGKGIRNEEIYNVKSLGILGMMERTLNFNGNLKIENVSEGGTLLSLTIPKEIKL